MTMIQQLLNLFRSQPNPPPAPIKVGSLWTAQCDEGNPFAEWAYRVEGVKAGWVAYRATTPKDGYVSTTLNSRKEVRFRDEFTLQEKEPPPMNDAL